MGCIKKKQVLNGDGWTIVGGSRGKQEAVEPSPKVRPTRIVEGLTVEKLKDELKDMEARWSKTTCAKFLSKTLSLRDWSFKEAVCIGTGSFSLDWEHRYRSMWQLVLFMAIFNLLQHDKPTITLYAQEPVFTPLDISFLRALNISVLSTSIESHITASSFVFAPFVDWFILLPMFLKDRDPELYIGNEILCDYTAFANTREKKNVLAECAELGKRFAEGRERRRVPEFELHGNALNGLMIYWREEQDEYD